MSETDSEGLQTEVEEEIEWPDPRPTDVIVSKIAEQAATDTAITPAPNEWVRALPELDGVACEWTMEDSLDSSYVWFDDGDYYAAELPPGLEDREERALDRYEAAALLDGGVFHSPVDVSEVPADV